MGTYGDVARRLARLEQRVAAAAPEPAVRFWIREREGGDVRCPSTGEALTQAAFDARFPGTPRFTLALAHAGGDWEPAADGTGAEPDGGRAAAGWPRSAGLADYQRIAQEEGR